MSWGTTFNTEIYLNRQEYKNVFAVEEQIEELEDSIQTSEQRILMFAASNIKDVTPQEWENEPIQYVNNEVKELLDLIKQEHEQLLYLQLYLVTLKQAK